MLSKIPKEKLIDFFKILKTIYAVKDSIRTFSKSNDIKGIKGICYGEEAISIGVCSALEEGDIIVNTYDGISSLIARGGRIDNIFAEILGKTDGYNNGLRGYLNISVPEMGLYSANSMSDTQVAMSTGFALASKIKGEKKVVAAFYNNSTSNEGVIHESMNIASAFKLPVLFICQNRVSIDDEKLYDFNETGKFSGRSVGYEMEGFSVNGVDISTVYLLTKKIVSKIRESQLPAVLECDARYYYESFNENNTEQNDKNDSERKALINKLVLDNFVKMLLSGKVLDNDAINKIEEDINLLVADAKEFGKNSKVLDYETLKSSIYANPYKNMPKTGWLL
jgi:TPP-dependent pyruvate/acetoin dehydrogenase alpha subunit